MKSVRVQVRHQGKNKVGDNVTPHAESQVRDKVKFQVYWQVREEL